MIRFYLIRHGKTPGNKKKRYIGTTDEPLCPEGIQSLREKHYFTVQKLFSSPLKRCLETGSIIYPDLKPEIIPDLAECDFGEFENKSARELSDNPNYQRWIDSNGRLPFPGGESREDFTRRSVNGFLQAVDICRKNKVGCASLVVHGGTIMSIMESFAWPPEEYYFWQPENGEGFQLDISEEQLYDMDIAGSRAGIMPGSAGGGSKMAVSSGASHWKTDLPGGKNYKKLFAEE